MRKLESHRKHILLVDDEKNMTQLLRMLLETRGYDVDVAHSGREALQVASPQLDLIILDLVLPDFSGFEVCRRLKQQQETAHIPIIMLSARSLYEDRIEGLYLGADDFLSKPCEHEELLARMEVAIRRTRLLDADPSNVYQNTIICELRKILDEALVVPYYQPIYYLEPFRLLGLEILTRPSTKGILANPEVFFKAAIKYGLYTELEMLSWTLALQHLAPHVGNNKIFLNCNPYFLETSQFLKVKAIFERNHIPAANVFLEITERSAITDFKLFYQHLADYREYGFRFAVDDVGGGYASLESIVETRPEVVKIDRHIVKDITKDAFKKSIVKFIVNFCQENHIISIAEGIETKEDLEALRDLGVNAGQGYLLYKPTTDIDIENISRTLH